MALDGELTSHEEVRRRVVAALRKPKRRESLRVYFPDDVRYKGYVDKMEVNGEWGDNYTLNMMGLIWDVNIAVLRLNGGGGYMWNRVYNNAREGHYLGLYFCKRTEERG